MLSSLCVVSNKRDIRPGRRFAGEGRSCETLIAELNIALASRFLYRLEESYQVVRGQDLVVVMVYAASHL